MDNNQHGVKGLAISRCVHCQLKKGEVSEDAYSIWHKEKMVYPDFNNVPLPNSDLNNDIIDDYNEASNILNKSPRGAAALLRLCIEKLCVQLGEKGKDLNTDIGNLVKKGLPVQIQQALDYVRVIGNNAVHPGQIDLKDDADIATVLFRLVNRIADMMITEPKQTQELYDSRPNRLKTKLKIETDHEKFSSPPRPHPNLPHPG